VAAPTGHLNFTVAQPLRLDPAGFGACGACRDTLQPKPQASPAPPPLPAGPVQPAPSAAPLVAAQQAAESSDDAMSEWSTVSDDGNAATPCATDAASGEPQSDAWWLRAPPGGRWPFRMQLVPSAFDPAEFALWRRYQTRVHGDKPHELRQSSFTRFLVDNPFGGGVARAEDASAPKSGYGAFHLQFWVGEHLAAVSVVDILPR